MAPAHNMVRWSGQSQSGRRRRVSLVVDCTSRAPAARAFTGRKPDTSRRHRARVRCQSPLLRSAPMLELATTAREAGPGEEILARALARFGHDGLRPGQAEAIADVLAGRPVIGVMPTGAGKSLC